MATFARRFSFESRAFGSRILRMRIRRGDREERAWRWSRTLRGADRAQKSRRGRLNPSLCLAI
jgi:hypothetical protein